MSNCISVTYFTINIIYIYIYIYIFDIVIDETTKFTSHICHEPWPIGVRKPHFVIVT